MQVELVSPEAILFSGECTQVLARTIDGDIAFLSNHAAFIGALDVGETQLWTDDGIVSLAVNGGFIEVSSNNVTLLSDGAFAAADIDAAEAQADLDAAEAALSANSDDESAAAAKTWAQVRLSVAAGGAANH
ncbi:MAG: ATP synthase F1 subunit epsilon [Acidimicrobiales bacterium]|jgi:F-type H+-transporting ATPase subunit epsilon